jgi:hypothetical protein
LWRNHSCRSTTVLRSMQRASQVIAVQCHAVHTDHGPSGNTAGHGRLAIVHVFGWWARGLGCLQLERNLWNEARNSMSTINEWNQIFAPIFWWFDIDKRGHCNGRSDFNVLIGRLFSRLLTRSRDLSCKEFADAHSRYFFLWLP